MITLAIAAILATLAAPSFTGIIKNNRLATQYNELLTHINLAKSEAVKRGTDIKILSNNGQNWESGWTVFEDANDDGSVDAGEELRVAAAAPANITIHSNVAGMLTYKASGIGGSARTITLCDDRANPEAFAKALIINTVGRVRVAEDSDNDGIVNGGDTNNVSCP